MRVLYLKVFLLIFYKLGTIRPMPEFLLVYWQQGKYRVSEFMWQIKVYQSSHCVQNLVEKYYLPYNKTGVEICSR